MKSKISLIWSLGILFCFSCSILEGPEEISNPLDPSDPNFEPPTVTFTTSPENGAAVAAHEVTFAWEGNQPNMQFKYQLDSNAWSEWSSEQSVTYTYLDEHAHTFHITSKYFNGVEQDTPQKIEFAVNDIQGPALMFIPRRMAVSAGSSIQLRMLAEEVTNVAGIKAQIQFNPDYLQVQTIQIYEDTSAFLTQNGGTVVGFSDFDNSAGTITMDIGIATGNPQTVTGYGVIGHIQMEATTSGETTLQYKTSSELRDADNQTISGLTLPESIIQIQ